MKNHVKEFPFQAASTTSYLSHWNIKCKALVKHWTQRPLLDVRLLLGNPLSVVEQIDLHVGIRQTRYIHPGQIASLQQDDSETGSRRLPTQ